jgi:hypothetical protein
MLSNGQPVIPAKAGIQVEKQAKDIGFDRGFFRLRTADQVGNDKYASLKSVIWNLFVICIL